METVMDHNLSIMAPISFIGSSYDAEVISMATQCAGELIEGVLNQTGVFNKSHDMSPVITAIARNEDRIKRVMKATDAFEVSAMIGNRATAAENSNVSGAVSQGLNPLLANVEVAMAELTRKIFAMYVMFSDDDEPIPFSYNGKFGEMEQKNLCMSGIINVKLKSVIKLEQALNSRNALQVLGFLGQSDYINKKPFISDIIPIAMQGLVSRTQAERYVNEKYQMTPEDEAKLRKAKEEMLKDPFGVGKLGPEEVDAALAQLTQQGLSQQQPPIPQGDPAAQLPVQQNAVQQGTTPEAAGEIANPGDLF